MLQRIQTLFLAMIVLAMLATSFLPIWAEQNPETGEYNQISALYHKHIPSKDAPEEHTSFPYFFIGILAIASATVALIEITKFKNRMLQMKLGLLNSLLLVATLGSIFWFTYQGDAQWIPEIRGRYQIGFFMPAIAVICNSLANRFIRKDENLVRSVDRIR